MRFLDYFALLQVYSVSTDSSCYGALNRCMYTIICICSSLPALGNSSTVTTQTSSIPMSCPPLPHFSDEKLRDSRVSKLAEKPRPPPRPVRTSVIATDMDSQEHSALYLTYV